MATALHDCPVCGGLRPAHQVCPHCDAAIPRERGPRLARSLAALLGAGAASLTLMACYGAPPGYYRPGPTDGCTDADHDLTCAPADCNDADRLIFPGAADDDGDGIDQNCDGIDGWADPNTVAAPVAGDAPDAAPDPTPPPP